MDWGGPDEEACEDMLGLNAVLAARFTTAAKAKTVLPTSPRTIRLATNGISAMAMENNTLTAPKRTIWLDPTNALRTPFPPNTALMLFICNAVIRTWRIAYSKPQL